jgi:hypothetical protein
MCGIAYLKRICQPPKYARRSELASCLENSLPNSNVGKFEKRKDVLQRLEKEA